MGRLARAAVLALGVLLPGHALAVSIPEWTTNGLDRCAGCHGDPPPFPQLNGAKSDSSVLDYAIPNMPLSCAWANSLPAGGASRIAIAQWMATLVPSTLSLTTTINTPKTIDVSTRVSAPGIAFQGVQTVTGLAGGTGSLGAWSGTSILYTPPSSTFVGNVSFTFRGFRSSPSVLGRTYTVNLQVGSVPTVTSLGTHSGTVGVPLSTSPGNYTITANNAPTGFGSASLPSGLSRSGATISGTPAAAGTFASPTVFASNALGAGPNKSVTFTIGKGTPILTFNTQSGVNYAPGSATFPIPSPATFTPPPADTQLLATYTSSTPSVCTTPGTTSTTVTIVSAGTCTLTASFAGNTNWFAAATPAARNVQIAKINQTVSFASPQSPSSQNWSSGGTFGLNPVATTTAAAQAGIAIAYSSADTSVCTITGTTITKVAAGTCTINATEDGNTNYNAATAAVPATITINAVAPSAPTIQPSTAGDTTASIAFLPSTTTGGKPISTYTATCTAAGQTTRTGSSLSSPISVINLVNNVTYSCSVTATNTQPLTSAASGSVNVMPTPTPVPPQITSANNTTFTVTQAGTFNVTATGTPAPTLSLTGVLPSNVTFTPATGALAGTPVSGTAGTYPLTILADGTNPDATQNFTLTIAKKNQTISFTDPADSQFGTGNVPLTATATSTLGVTFVSLTPTICGISGANATMLDVGICTLEAQQAGNADWNAATPKPQQSFTISQGPQTITFNAQTVASRAIVPGGTFLVAPTATASSNLPVSYSTSTPTVCTGNSTSITMQSVGTCTIVASQGGNAQYLAASDATQNVTITISSQSITFGAQAPQPYSPGGTFQVPNPATASSGLPVTYSTDTTSVCTVAGTTVSIVSVGTCTLKADQAGNANYTPAATVTANVQIQAVAPDAPTIGTATPQNGQATITFTAPANDGGSPVTSYIATCNPGAKTGTASASPITVLTLTNNQAYTCSVAAINAAGTGASSATVGVTPSAQGPALWIANCQTCHGPVPNGGRFNASGTTTNVLDYVITVNPAMNIPALTGISHVDRLDIVAYITSYLASIDDVTVPNVAKTINVGSHLTLGGFAFDRAVVVTPPLHGTLSVFNGTEIVYTPNPGYSGPDSFSYRGQLGPNPSPTVAGDARTVAINVTAAAPLLTVVRTGTGTGQVASTSPTTGIACGSDCSEAYNTGTLVTLTATPDPGTTFIGWSGACTGTAPCDVTMSVARNVTATFDLTPFDFTVSRAGTGSGTVTSSPTGINCGATCVVGFAPGTVVTLSQGASVGSQFTGWSGACTGTGACIVTMSSAKSVTATFQPSFMLTASKAGTGSGNVTSAPAGIDCGVTCSFEYLTGTLVGLTATPAAGSTFTGWSGACTGTGACNVTMDAAKSVTATFAPVFALGVTFQGSGAGTVTSAPSGINCSATCSADYVSGTSVALTAVATLGSKFTGWGGACSGTGACNVTLDTAHNVTATFVLAPALAVTRNGTGAGTVTSAPAGIACGLTCALSFDLDTVVTLGQSPAVGSIFAGWSGACSGSGSCIVTMSTARAVTATFNTAPSVQADLSIASQSANPTAAAVGQNVTFTLNVVNNGPNPATGVVLADTVPPGSTFQSASAGCTHASGTVTCNIGSLASGASALIDVVVRPTVAGTMTNNASVSAAQADPFGFNNSSSLGVPVAAPVRLGNISTRMQVLTGNDVLIGGFVINGAGNKTVAIVATGPSLTQYGIANALANPTLTLVRQSDQTVIATNDDWQSAGNAAQLQAAGFAPANPLESAILVSLAPGAYTAIVSGAGGGTGVGIVAVYEVDHPEYPLINISTRGQVLTGNDVMIGGFIVFGSTPQRLAIVATGPSLTQYGIANALANPTLTLVRQSDQAVIGTNDDWQTDASASQLQSLGFSPSNPVESAILVTLPPGAYTAILSGKNGGTGVGIIGVYAAP